MHRAQTLEDIRRGFDDFEAAGGIQPLVDAMLALGGDPARAEQAVESHRRVRRARQDGILLTRQIEQLQGTTRAS